MVAQRDADRSGNVHQNPGDGDGRPTEIAGPQRGEGPGVDEQQRQAGGAVVAHALRAMRNVRIEASSFLGVMRASCAAMMDAEVAAGERYAARTARCRDVSPRTQSRSN